MKIGDLFEVLSDEPNGAGFGKGDLVKCVGFASEGDPEYQIVNRAESTPDRLRMFDQDSFGVDSDDLKPITEGTAMISGIPIKGTPWYCEERFSSDASPYGSFSSNEIYTFFGITDDDDFIFINESEHRKAKLYGNRYPGNICYPSEFCESLVFATDAIVAAGNERHKQKEWDRQQQIEKEKQRETWKQAGKCEICGASIGWFSRTFFGKTTCQSHS